MYLNIAATMKPVYLCVCVYVEYKVYFNGVKLYFQLDLGQPWSSVKKCVTEVIS